MKKILYITSSRADYFIIRPLLLKLKNIVNLEIIITGMHLSKKFGSTWMQVTKDFPNSKKLKINPDKNKNKIDILKIMNKLEKQFINYSKNNKYDFLMLLGDRSEILPFAVVSAMLNIPIIHFHGGEVTYGAYDEFIRHSISKMSSLHLVSCDKYKERLERMGEYNVYNVGAMGCQNINKFKYIKNVVNYKNYIVVLFHPETQKLNNINDVEVVLEACEKFINKTKFVFIGANNDVSGTTYNLKIKDFCNKHKFDFFESLDSNNFFSLVKDSLGIIGNSSSMLIEIPTISKPIVNIGDRQRGRERSEKIINCKIDKKDIEKSIAKLLTYNGYLKHNNPYYKKDSIENALKIISNYINKPISSQKEFNDKKN